MGGMDPSLFRIERPALEAYAASFGPSIAVERYSSAGGHMRSEGRLHRISLNRTPHRRYAFRYGGDRYRAIERPALTLGLQPAGSVLEVEGDGADYVSIYQAPDIYNDFLPSGSGFVARGPHALSAPANPATLHAVLCLAEAVDPSSPADRIMIEHLGIALACCVTRLLDARAPIRPELGDRALGQRALGQRALGRVVDHIEGAIGRAELGLGELAAVARLSPFHFSRAFKQATGSAPHQFVIARRVRRAQLLLAAGSCSQAQIAYETGFASQSHFASTFRRVTGMTPGQYRRTARL